MGKIRKVKIEAMLDILHDMWDKGVDYVDISKRENEVEDTLILSFCKAYMNKEYEHLFDESAEEGYEPLTETNNIEIKLSDSDLNELI